jgi:hypothetical protein
MSSPNLKQVGTAVTLMACIRKVPTLCLSYGTGYPEFYVVFFKLTPSYCLKLSNDHSLLQPYYIII